MRRFALFATIVAGPLSVCLLVGTSAAQQPGVPGARSAVGQSPAAAPVPAGTSVAVIDIAFVFKNHVRFNGAMNDIKKDIEAFEAFARDEQRKMQTKAEGLKAFNPSSPEFKRAEEELAHMQSNLQIEVAKKRKEFLERESKVYFDIYREVEQSVAVFAQRNRIGLVLRYSGDEMKPDDRASVMAGVARPVVFQQNLDITELVLAELNRGATLPSPGAAPPAGGIAPASQQPPVQTADPRRGPIVPTGPTGRPVR